MARLSDIIESFIKEMLNKNEGNQVLIQRNELADQFRCAPSQINYVLTTRFTYEKGYVIESRRGGGGYIAIKQVSYESAEHRNKLLYESIGNSITYHNSIAMLNNFIEVGLIKEKEYELIKMAINDRTLSAVEDKNRVRSDILKGMIMVVLS